MHNTVAAEQSWRIREYGAQSVFEDLAEDHQKAIGAETFTADELRSAVIGALAAARGMERAASSTGPSRASTRSGT